VIRTLVAAGRPTARAGLSAVLRAGEGIEVIGEAAGASDLLALAASLETAVVVLCDADSAWIAGAVRNGVRGVLPRDAESAEIAAAVTASAHGLLVLPANVARELLPLATSAPAQPAPSPGMQVEALTPRELEVLRLVSEGLGNKGIALRLKISEHTVKFHVAAAMAKLGAASRTEAVANAARRGLIML
jgi:DNA-binding NarL/FixJ family response regulator